MKTLYYILEESGSYEDYRAIIYDKKCYSSLEQAHKKLNELNLIQEETINKFKNIPQEKIDDFYNLSSEDFYKLYSEKEYQEIDNLLFEYNEDDKPDYSIKEIYLEE